MVHEKYESVIGLEVHCQLLTGSKAFSPDAAAFGAAANTNVDPVSLGHPGTLPVLNRQVVAFAMKMGLATHCTIAPRSELARKHYFYPDLPKGYQISQYETPICYGGYVEIVVADATGEEPASLKRIGLTRIHIEEDAGKSLHDQDAYATLVDYNRCGVPLIEIVSEPDIRSPREAYLYTQKIRQIVRYLGICDGNMEEGSLRCDANVSVRLRGQTTFGTKTEVKNMNSFRNVERALEYEIARQIATIERGGEVVQETRLWDANRLETRSMRSKEQAHDYRYFPDPDLVQIAVSNEEIEQVRASLPEMPERRRERLMKDFGLPRYDAVLLTDDRAVADYFEEALAALFKISGGGDSRAQAKAVSNMIMSDVMRVMNERSVGVLELGIDPERLAELIHMRMEDRISSTGAQDIFNGMLGNDLSPSSLAELHNLLQISDEGALIPVVDAVIEESQRQVEQYRSGKHSVIGYFIGQVMKNFDGSPDPKLVRKLLQQRLDA